MISPALPMEKQRAYQPPYNEYGTCHSHAIILLGCCTHWTRQLKSINTITRSYKYFTRHSSTQEQICFPNPWGGTFHWIVENLVNRIGSLEKQPDGLVNGLQLHGRVRFHTPLPMPTAICNTKGIVGSLSLNLVQRLKANVNGCTLLSALISCLSKYNPNCIILIQVLCRCRTRWWASKETRDLCLSPTVQPTRWPCRRSAAWTGMRSRVPITRPMGMWRRPTTPTREWQRITCKWIAVKWVSLCFLFSSLLPESPSDKRHDTLTRYLINRALDPFLSLDSGFISYLFLVKWSCAMLSDKYVVDLELIANCQLAIALYRSVFRYFLNSKHV